MGVCGVRELVPNICAAQPYPAINMPSTRVIIDYRILGTFALPGGAIYLIYDSYE